MNDKKLILPKLRFAGSQNEDLQLNLNLDSENTILRNGDRDVILNLATQFNKEKQACNKYKIFGKIRMIFRNQYLGESPYEKYLKPRLALKGYGTDDDWSGYIPYDEFAFIRYDLHKESINGLSISNMDNFTGFTSTATSGNTHQNIFPSMARNHNWNIYLSYISDSDANFPMKYTLSGNSVDDVISFVSGDGIVFRTQLSSNGKYYILTSPVKHGINVGEYIIIDNVAYYVMSVGNDVYNSEYYVINILATTVTFNKLVTGKRCVDISNSGETTSQYYVHKHKTLTDVNGYMIDNIGFESPIFEDEKKLLSENYDSEVDVLVVRNRMEAIIYEFTEPFVRTGLTNNLGYTPVDVYATTIFRNGNGLFLYPPKIGYSFHLHNTWLDEHFSGDTANETALSGTTFTREIRTGVDYTGFTSGNTLPIGSELYGAFIEYIPSLMTERVVSEAYHKIISDVTIFNHNQTSGSTYSGASANNPVGLIYQPHHRIPLRQLSPYVESYKTNDILNLPENVKYFSNENLFKWRDMYDLGYYDADGNGVDFMYMNDMLFAHKDFNFYFRNEAAYTNKTDGIGAFDDKNCKPSV